MRSFLISFCFLLLGGCSKESTNAPSAPQEVSTPKVEETRPPVPPCPQTPRRPSIFGYDNHYVPNLLKEKWGLNNDDIKLLKAQWNENRSQSAHSGPELSVSEVSREQVASLYQELKSLDCYLMENDDEFIVFALAAVLKKNKIEAPVEFIDYFENKIRGYAISETLQNTLNTYSYLVGIVDDPKTLKYLFFQLLNQTEIKVFNQQSSKIMDKILRYVRDQNIADPQNDFRFGINTINFLHHALVKKDLSPAQARSFFELSHDFFERNTFILNANDDELIGLHHRLILLIDYDYFKIIQDENKDADSIKFHELPLALLHLQHVISSGKSFDQQWEHFLDEIDSVQFSGIFKVQKLIRIDRPKFSDYLEAFYQAQFYRLALARFLSVQGPVTSLENKNISKAQELYKKQLSYALEAIKLGTSQNYTEASLQKKLIGIQKYKSDLSHEEEVVEEESSVVQINKIELKDGLGMPGFIMLNSDTQLISGKELRFHPLNFILTCGHNLEIKTNSSMFGVWIEASPCLELPAPFPHRDRGMFPRIEMFDYSTEHAANNVFVLHHPGWPPAKNTSGNNGRHGSRINIKVGENIYLIPQFLGIGQDGQSGLPGFNSPLVRDGVYQTFNGIIGNEEDSKNLYGQVTIIGNRTFKKMIGRRNYRKNADGSQGEWFEPETKPSDLNISRGAGGDGGLGGDGPIINFISKNEAALSTQFMSVIFLNGSGGKGATPGAIGPTSDDMENLKGSDGKKGNAGELRFSKE